MTVSAVDIVKKIWMMTPRKYFIGKVTEADASSLNSMVYCLGKKGTSFHFPTSEDEVLEPLNLVKLHGWIFVTVDILIPFFFFNVKCFVSTTRIQRIKVHWICIFFDLLKTLELKWAKLMEDLIPDNHLFLGRGSYLPCKGRSVSSDKELGNSP